MIDQSTDKNILDRMISRISLTPRAVKFSTSGHLLALDLSFLNLHTLPAELWLFRNLRRFTCIGNSLSELPPEIGAWTRLEQLNVAGNGLVRIPSEIGALTRLKKTLSWPYRHTHS
jgi:Leucine-rich repeat (LRR) protein